MHNFIKKISEKSFSQIVIYFYDLIKVFVRNVQYNYQIHKKYKISKIQNFFVFKYNDKYNEVIKDSDFYISKKYLEHSFDLLGTGWKKNCISENTNLCEWIEKKVPDVYCLETNRLCNIIRASSPNYKFINWQCDYKNEYTFDGKIRSKHIKIQVNSGYDIKIPWELARGQHLPYLARLFLSTKDEKYLYEIKNEILDFIAFNPVGYGVNWICGMDIGIRVSNWVMAVAICYHYDKKEIFDKQFICEMKKSVLQHSIYLKNHLEDKRNYRGNHYFANIVGLLFSSLFLDESKWRTNTVRFSVVQLLKSIDEQFYDDGGNFEASIAYHKLTLEMAIYGMWILWHLKSNKEDEKKIKKILMQYNSLYDKCLRKLQSAIGFFFDTLKPNYDIYQLGDNDSGHMFRFFHFGAFMQKKDYLNKYFHIDVCNDEMVWDENEMSGKELVYLIEAFLQRETTSFFGCLKNGFFNENKKEFDYKEKKEQLFIKSCINESFKLPYYKKQSFDFLPKIDIIDVHKFQYPIFGYYGFKSDNLFFGLFAGENGQKGIGGHSHNDKLSCELQINGKDVIIDPGSYLYTPNIDKRNKFKSTTAHFVPFFGEEQADLGEDCFRLRQETKCEVLCVNCNEMIFKCEYKKYIHIRRVLLMTDMLIIEDYSNKPIIGMQTLKIASNGYGKLVRMQN